MLKVLKNWIDGGYLQQKGWINRLNNVWTPRILIILFIVSYVWRYIENPVDCWCPAEFKEPMVKYTNQICWRNDFMYYPMVDHSIPKFQRRISQQKKIWDKWIPFIFLLQAVLFKIPGVIMSVGESKLGFKRNKLYGLADGYTKLSMEDRASIGKQLSRYLNQWLKNRIIAGFPIGLLTVLVGLVYFMYLVNVTVQLTVLDKLIKSPNFTNYGAHLLFNLLANDSLPVFESPMFNRIFLCDFKIRKLQNIQFYTVQCINNIHLLYEQLFAFLWIWLILTSVVTHCSCVLRFLEVILPFLRTRYIKQFLQSENIVVHTESDVSRFANNVLGEDGVIVLKGIGELSSEFLVRDAVINLWFLNYGHRGFPQQQLIVPNRPLSSDMASNSVGMPTRRNQPSAPKDGATGDETVPLVQLNQTSQ